jgi:hypothetical protein
MRVLPFVLSALVVAACSGSTTTIGGDDTLDGSPGGGNDGSSGGTADGSTGLDSTTGNDGGSNPGTDAAPPGDDGSTPGQVNVTINVTDLFEDCQPVVQPDPVQMKGTISVQNNMKTAVGPIAMADGAFLDPNKSPVAAFKIRPVSIPTLDPGQSGQVDIEKLVPTMVPAQGCSTLQCGGKYIVQVTLTAPQLSNYDARTVPIPIGCTK